MDMLHRSSYQSSLTLITSYHTLSKQSHPLNSSETITLFLLMKIRTNMCCEFCHGRFTVHVERFTGHYMAQFHTKCALRMANREAAAEKEYDGDEEDNNDDDDDEKPKLCNFQRS